MSVTRVNRGWSAQQKKTWERKKRQNTIDRMGLYRRPSRRTPDETYYMDTALTQVISNVGIVNNLNIIQQGDDIYQREGRKITLLSSTLMFDLQMPDTGADNSIQRTCRCALIYDLHPNQAAPLYTDVWTGITNIGGLIPGPFVEANFNNKDRFKILKVWTFQTGTVGHLAAVPLGTAQMVSGIPSSIMMPQRYFKRLNLPAQYAGTGLVGAVTGGLFFTHISDDPTGTWAINFYHRLSYIA